MNAENDLPAAAQAETVAIAAAPNLAQGLQWAVAVVAVLGLVTSGLLWQKLSNIQEQLARQSAEASAQATQAAGQSKQAQAVAMETAAKLAVTEARLAEVSLQRTQLEELMQSLSRSRDENLVVDIESAVRLAQQQSQLTGSAEPLLAALKSAEVRITRAAQPRLTPLQRAIARDVARIKGTVLADTPTLLVKLDELVSLADDLTVANAVSGVRGSEPLKRKPDESVATWWVRMGLVARDELRGLVRVSRVEVPEAALLSPEQSFFLRENLKLKLLNARMGLLARQNESLQVDLTSCAALMRKYVDMNARKSQQALQLIEQSQAQLRKGEMPRLDGTLSALATAAAGR